MAKVDANWISVRRSIEEDKDASGFRRRMLAGPGHDPCILGDIRDTDGRRFLQFALVFSLIKEAAMEHWHIQWPRSVKDYVGAIRALGAGSFLEFHADWVKTSGVGDKSASAREHRFLLDLLRLLVQFDQLDPTCLASAELLVRPVL